ncbi:MAG: SRPBCC domain-containing protein [Actinomycetota bacterium]
MTDRPDRIELEVEVPGTPEEVWRAIATGPGITSWYVPHTIEERPEGAASARFGEGPEMEVPGRVAEWDPPRRIVMDGGDPTQGLVFEWIIEARDGGRCVVRLINSGFGRGGEWDDQFDAMTEGWRMFMANLGLHLEHHRGETATVRLGSGYVAAAADAVWTAMVEALGIEAGVAPGGRVSTSGDGVPALAGDVELIDGESRPHLYLLRLDTPVTGTALVGVESMGEATSLSVWTYLYGPEAESISNDIGPAFQAVLDRVVAGFGD